MACHKYTPEQDKFLRDNVSGRSIVDLTELFNKHFRLDLKYSQIRGAVKNRRLCCGFDSRFKKGNTPLNKGKKGLHISKSTEYKPGNIPLTYKPVGTVVVDAYGYTKIKVADPNIWKYKHKLIWESVHGSLQKGEIVIFGDGDKTNFGIDNLIKVSRSELGVLNKKGLIKDDTELTRTGILIANVIMKSSEVRKKRTKSRKA